MREKFVLSIAGLIAGLVTLAGCASSSQGVMAASSSSQPDSVTNPDANPIASAAPCADKSGDAVTIREELCQLVNKARAAQGLPPVQLEVHRSAAAQKHAADMVNNNYFSHASLDGRQASERLKAEGVSVQAWGENIAQGQASPTAVMSSWMNSPGHRANILGANYRRLGIGLAGRDWVQDFTD